ncbi:MAG: FAD-dependent oxidoreductase [Bacteroidota bacterium]|nr:FAD-dependent oxidoreductase [Bacteroidota bacterium]
MNNHKSNKILVVGAGIVGCTVAYELDRLHYKVHLMDNDHKDSSSTIAAGLFNPITGKRWLKTWMADEIFPYMSNYYKEFEKSFHVKLFHQIGLFKPFDSVQEQNNWASQLTDEAYQNWVEIKSANEIKEKTVVAPFGGFYVPKAGWLDTRMYISSIINYFQEKSAFEILHIDAVKITEVSKKYDSIIFCEGWKATMNPLWKWLPFNLCKGELIEVESNDYFGNYINNKSVFVLPISEIKYKIGSTYEWHNLNYDITQEAKDELVSKANKFILSPLKVTNQWAGIRPSTSDRRPFLGVHPEHSNLYIVNGFGSKAVSLTPYFINEFVKYYTEGKELMPEIDIKRFLDYFYKHKHTNS